MTTSGTVAQTTIDTAKLLEHAFRRVRVHPSKQTPEKVQLAKENLYLLLTALSNRGINLWAIEEVLVGCVDGQAVYQCPAGTVDLLNLIYSTPTRSTGTDTTAATSITTQLSSATNIVRIGIKLSAVTASDTLTLASSSDGVSWTTIQTEVKTDWATGTWYWFDLDTQTENTYFRASFGSAATFTEFYLASSVADLPVVQWNRDTWSVINNKAQQGAPSTNYYFEKLLRPQVTLWPVPNTNYNHLTMFVHRQVQDVGTLLQTIEVPQRWVEPVIWQLSVRLAFELEEVDPAIATLVVQMADKYTFEAEDEETDGAPLYLTPGIGVYTR